VPGYNVRYTLCRWVDAVKNMPSMLKTWLKRVWQKDGDLPQDYTYHSSEMRGELDALHAIKQETNEQLEKAMKAPINEDKIRKAGW
jgi:putative NADPH-quinone reductase